jgi:hypothetical protein
MGKDKFPLAFEFNDKGVKKLQRIAALLGLEDSNEAVSHSVHLAAHYAEAYVKGKTEFVFCTPELAASIKNYPDFFKALCQEGVIEWLTPFVLGKTATSPEENQ